jgi:hypothetical protein
MDPILQTLTLAIILLIAGIICMVIGVVGLVWKTGYDRRRMEKVNISAILGENADYFRQQPRSRHEEPSI